MQNLKKGTSLGNVLGQELDQEITKKPYSIINQILLKHSGEYATFKQWSDLGGHIKKGEKSEIVVFWKIYQKEETNEETGEKEVRKIPVLKYYNVFHISQVEGVKPLEVPFREVEPIEEADKIITMYVNREHLDFKELPSNKATYCIFHLSSASFPEIQST